MRAGRGGSEQQRSGTAGVGGLPAWWFSLSAVRGAVTGGELMAGRSGDSHWPGPLGVWVSAAAKSRSARMRKRGSVQPGGKATED
ncbi:hypothetical protein E2562_030622 [Oryza meyeriana var. granulata]|uniref:Uncharacterized protein n=1 Tax=Oryza meyeriana var. granulata TaxID=110450 RepID=A0A6G1CKP4_9ORYZ|nr:hypothetical protein E2562_030622 [Oryza meyeriana var. granulata]